MLQGIKEKVLVYYDCGTNMKNKLWIQFLFPFQEKHKQELEDMRKAGHEALSIIVDEYKVGSGGSADFANPRESFTLGYAESHSGHRPLLAVCVCQISSLS